MKHRSPWLALPIVVLVYGRVASTQTPPGTIAQPTVMAPAGVVRMPPRTPARQPSLRSIAMPTTAPAGIVAAPAMACTDTGVQTCGLGACMVTVARCSQGRAVTCAPNVNQRVPETCDGVDNDCDGVVDNAPGSTAARSACPAPRACEPVRVVALRPGVTQWRLEPSTGNACASPVDTGAAPTSNELQVVNVATRLAVVLSTSQGSLQLFGANGKVLQTTAGLCAPGAHAGATILEPGTYVVRATGDAERGARVVSVEAVGVPARAQALVPAGAASVSMSTAGPQSGPFECRTDDGVDVRVLVCPTGRTAVLSSPQGFVASLEGASGARTCYPVAANHPQSVPVPGGRLVVVRAWPSGAERGPATVTLR